ncbi:hypothetical protein [Altericroceibacterium xinjiangense]|uniref:hypothetical protein n=1 Tax=Altericroceibacterium xinjiangense TaxID=762261 RepID=UPI000F7EAE39|nr:hypothetical protein [Altericroceibacterium xinjiangense]
MHIDPALRPVPLRARLRGPSERIRSTLLALAGGRGRITQHTERSWASITFAGSRHEFTLLFEGAEAVEAGEVFVTLLPEHEFDLRKHLVADATVVAVDHRVEPLRMEVTIELLLVEEE